MEQRRDLQPGPSESLMQQMAAAGHFTAPGFGASGTDPFAVAPQTPAGLPQLPQGLFMPQGMAPAERQQPASSVSGVSTSPPSSQPLPSLYARPPAALTAAGLQQLAGQVLPGAYGVPPGHFLHPMAYAQLLQLHEQAAMVQAQLAAGATPASTSVPPAPTHIPRGPLPAAAGTYPLASAPVDAPRKVVTKVLLSYGGMSSTTTAGMWEYMGGETRLLGGIDPDCCSFEQLAARVEQEAQVKLGPEVVLRYELPGCPGTLVDLKCDTDVANMWSEWHDFCSLSKQPHFKLHLYVDRPAIISARTSISTGGSAGSAGTTMAGSAQGPGTPARLTAAGSGPQLVATSTSSGPLERATSMGTAGEGQTGACKQPAYGTVGEGATSFMPERMSITATPFSLHAAAALPPPPSAPRPPPAAAVAETETAAAARRTPRTLTPRTSGEMSQAAQRARARALTPRTSGEMPKAAPRAQARTLTPRRSGEVSEAAQRAQPSPLRTLGDHVQQQLIKLTQAHAFTTPTSTEQAKDLTPAESASAAPAPEPTSTSFERLLSRVKSSVEVVRPADLRILRFIGSGGFADVYLAKWLGVEVAVKCLRDLPGAHTSTKAAVKELLREASVLCGMRHPNVLCLYAVAIPDCMATAYKLRPPTPQDSTIPSPTTSSPSTPGTPTQQQQQQQLQADHTASPYTHRVPPHTGAALPRVQESSQEADNGTAERDREASGLRGVGSQLQEQLGTNVNWPAAATQATAHAAPAANLKENTMSAAERVENMLRQKRRGQGLDAAAHPPAADYRQQQQPAVQFHVLSAQQQRSPFDTGIEGTAAPSASPFAAAAQTERSLCVPLSASFSSPAGIRVQPASPRSTTTTAQPAAAAPPLSGSPAPGSASALAASLFPPCSAALSSAPTSVTANISFGLGSASSLPLLPSLTPPHIETATDLHEASQLATAAAVAAVEQAVLHKQDTTAATAINYNNNNHQNAAREVYNTQEDEMIRKAVQAADAAAAASADAESQTALSEGLIARPALVSEFLMGCCLSSAITRKADFLNSDMVLIKVAMDAARGMEYCHAKHVTHWNLKPGNLIVGFSSDKVPLCKLADVGVLRMRQLSELDEAGVARVLPWAAPELVRAPDTATEKVDVYSFGMVLWSMWSRKHPYSHHDIARVYLRTMQGHVVRPPLPGSPEWDAKYPGERSPHEPAAGWSDLTQRCWAQQPADRPSFSEIAGTLIGMFTAAKAAKRASRAAAVAKPHTLSAASDSNA